MQELMHPNGNTIQVIRGQPGKPEPEIQTVTAK
jgi:hypothetical protein